MSAGEKEKDMDTSLNSFKMLSRSSVSPSMPVVSSQLLKTFWSLRHVLNTHTHKHRLVKIFVKPLLLDHKIEKQNIPFSVKCRIQIFSPHQSLKCSRNNYSHQKPSFLCVCQNKKPNLIICRFSQTTAGDSIHISSKQLQSENVFVMQIWDFYCRNTLARKNVCYMLYINHYIK